MCHKISAYKEISVCIRHIYGSAGIGVAAVGFQSLQPVIAADLKSAVLDIEVAALLSVIAGNDQLAAVKLYIAVLHHISIYHKGMTVEVKLPVLLEAADGTVTVKLCNSAGGYISRFIE